MSIRIHLIRFLIGKIPVVANVTSYGGIELPRSKHGLVSNCLFLPSPESMALEEIWQQWKRIKACLCVAGLAFALLAGIIWAHKAKQDR